jgi:hypothetical protein
MQCFLFHILSNGIANDSAQQAPDQQCHVAVTGGKKAHHQSKNPEKYGPGYSAFGSLFGRNVSGLVMLMVAMALTALRHRSFFEKVEKNDCTVNDPDQLFMIRQEEYMRSGTYGIIF